MRLLLLALLFSTSLFALINGALHTPITSVDEENEEATIATLKDTEVGMYGAVSHWFDERHAIALSWVEITKIDGDVTTLKLHPILSLVQSALPTGTWKVKVGDDVAMGYNYQRAMLIAPNASIYRKITTYHSDRQWVHPDIFASTLSSNGHPSPLKEDFNQVCKANNIGTIAFMFDKSIVTVDCRSFKIIKNKSTSIKSKEQQVPFYTRVPHIADNWFGEGNDEIENYDKYYVELLAQHNTDNEWMNNYLHKRQQLEGDDTSWFESFFNSIKVTFGGDDVEDD